MGYLDNLHLIRLHLDLAICDLALTARLLRIVGKDDIFKTVCELHDRLVTLRFNLDEKDKKAE